ncbi:hypothetical protein CYLTODRAFT_431474 [Cylindrobasidium torrendii FP15055 ss-10]|uniref:ARM repeat-containing protein n=1 Tax=Cylindrobasidium torrendii FP15055 ss-10 TaxID=1314674 RepID=A0A0D7BCF1_9AGAR|nr:hypothetical protein CYLTODRAFT_431474 [Cylindrobasidium torrendii FP15055 ss-10]
MTEGTKSSFQRLKVVCVPLLGAASLTPATTSNTLRLLSQVLDILRAIHASGEILSESILNYVFFPVSAILQRNKSIDIPNQIFEKVLLILAQLCEDWWWTIDMKLWQQIFMLAGGVLGDMEAKEMKRTRDNETKEAAAVCLHALLRVRSTTEGDKYGQVPGQRLDVFKDYARAPGFVPILGQTLNSLLTTAGAPSLSLQLACLAVVRAIIAEYLSNNILPSILPGVVSTSTKLALNSTQKGWANGDLVAAALDVLTEIVVLTIGDEPCIRDGAIKPMNDLEDIASCVAEPEAPNPDTKSSFETLRTPSWLQGTSSQLHIALNAFTPLVKHPTPAASRGLLRMSHTILSATPNTLPQSQQLLLSFLLSISISEYPNVSNEAQLALANLLQSKYRHVFLQTLMLSTRDNLLALPRLLTLIADAKVEHAAGLVEAVCRLAPTSTKASNPISTELARLLGPSGGIEKWGWSLLSVLEFDNPVVVVNPTSTASLRLENGGEHPEAFPEMMFKNVTMRSTYVALLRMFHALGNAAGDGCLFAVEWFTGVGQTSTAPSNVAAMWCACRLLEGRARVDLLVQAEIGDSLPDRQLSKVARALAKSAAHVWDQSDSERIEQERAPKREHENLEETQVLHLRGIDQVSATLNIIQDGSTKPRRPSTQPILHRALLLQLISISAGVLQGRFGALFMDCLYPVLHSLVSPVAFLSGTALASLHFITQATSFASPANLLLSNFDYVLNSVSRRLTRRWLDVDATKVLVVMIRLVGDGIVEKAADVVEECFDRLDDYHGYDILVEGLIEVLSEITKVIKHDKELEDAEESPRNKPNPSVESLDGFFDWYAHRLDVPKEEGEAFGSTPQEAWGTENANEVDPIVNNDPDPEDIPPTPTQILTKQIVIRSLYFLTHHSPVIRARILTLLSSSASSIRGKDMLPSVHTAWPFVLNRLADPEPFVISAAAELIEALAMSVGTFMFRRTWDDVWPRFKAMLDKMDKSDSASALARRGPGAVGTESAYTHSHRLYRSLMRTMTATLRGVDPKDTPLWEVIMAFRRFLHAHAHEELQACARELYIAIGKNNKDAVWLGLKATTGEDLGVQVRSLRQPKWDIDRNVEMIFDTLDT